MAIKKALTSLSILLLAGNGLAPGETSDYKVEVEPVPHSMGKGRQTSTFADHGGGALGIDWNYDNALGAITRTPSAFGS